MKRVLAWALLSSASGIKVKPGFQTDSLLQQEAESEGTTVPLHLTATIPPMEVNLTGMIGGVTFNLSGEMPKVGGEEPAAAEDTGPKNNTLLVDSKVRPTDEGMASFATLFNGVRDGQTPKFKKVYQATRDGFSGYDFYPNIRYKGDAGIILIKTTEGGSFGYYFDFAVSEYKKHKNWKSFMFYFDEAGAHKIKLSRNAKGEMLYHSNNRFLISTGEGWRVGSQCDQQPWTGYSRSLPGNVESWMLSNVFIEGAPSSSWNFGYNFQRPAEFTTDKALSTKIIGGDKWFANGISIGRKSAYGHFYQCAEIEYYLIDWQ